MDTHINAEGKNVCWSKAIYKSANKSSMYSCCLLMQFKRKNILSWIGLGMVKKPKKNPAKQTFFPSNCY